jgi:hypothetical protein
MTNTLITVAPTGAESERQPSLRPATLATIAQRPPMGAGQARTMLGVSSRS